MSTSLARREDVSMITRRMFSPSLIIRMWLDIQVNLPCRVRRAAAEAPAGVPRGGRQHGGPSMQAE